MGRLSEHNNTQELQLIPQAPVITQPQMQIINNDTGEAIAKTLENVQIPEPVVEVIISETDLHSMANSYMLNDPRFKAFVQPVPAQPVNNQPASALLVQHTQNQANMSGNATVQAIQQNKEQLVKVNNDVKVDIKAAPVSVTLDNYQIGQAMTRYTTTQTIREGGGG